MEFCKKKEKNCLTPYLHGAEVGDNYTYLSHKRKSNFWINFHVGKWVEESCNQFYAVLAQRVRLPTVKRKITIYSDGNKQNITGISTNFRSGTVHYAMRKKIKKSDKIIGVVGEIIFGNPKRSEIRINGIDGFCSKLRERISCFTRKGRAFAKKRIGLEQRLEILSVQHNFMETKRGKTPAMMEGLTDKKWTWATFFNQRLTTLS